MKIPQYKRQVGFPKQTGAEFLSARANPSSFAAPGAAFADLGGTIQTEGFRWLQKEIETERTAQQASNYNEISKIISSVQEGVRTTNVEEWLDPQRKGQIFSNLPGVPQGVTLVGQQIQTMHERATAIESHLYKAVKSQAANVSNRTTRNAIISSGNKSVAAAMVGIRASLRTRYSDYANAQLENYIDHKVREASIATNGGEIAEHTLQEIDSVIEWGGALGGHKRTDIEKRKKQARSSADTSYVRRALSDANKNDNLVQTQDLISDLSNVNKLRNLDESARARLITTAQRQEVRIQSRILAQEENEFNRADKERKRLQDTNNADIGAKIRAWRNGNNEAPEAATPRAKENLIEQLNDLVNIRGLSETQYNRRIEEIEGRDKINDPDHYHEVLQEIDDVVTDEELTTLEENINDEYSRGIIGFKSFDGLTTRIKNTRGKTLEDQERKKYATAIQDIMGYEHLDFAAAMHKGMFKESTSRRMDKTGAIRFFEQEITDGKRPAVAFYNVLKAYVQTEQQQLEAVNIVRNLSARLEKNPFSLESNISLNIDNIARYASKNNVQKARVALRDQLLDKKLPDEALEQPLTSDQASALQRKGIITPEQRLTVRQYIEMERQITFLENVMLQKIIPPVEEMENKQELKTDDDGWVDRTLDSITDFFVGGDDDVSATEEAETRGAGGGS